MASINLRHMITPWLGLALALILANCANQSPVREDGRDQLPLGLYKVVERDCSYPPDMPEDCSQTRYLELLKGAFRSFGKDEIAFVTWLSDNPDKEHVFNVRDLRHGKFIGDHEYVIEDDSLGKEWFVVDGEITDYFFVRYPRKTPAGDMAGRTHLVLRRVGRTGKINRLLQYPADDDLQKRPPENKAEGS